MNRSKLNFIFDIIGFVAFVFLTATGILMYYILPPGSGRYRTIWGWDRHQWGDLHFWLAIVLLAVLAIHLVLHWRWIVCMVKGRMEEGSSARIGLGLLAVFSLVAVAAAPLLSPVLISSESGYGEHGGHGGHGYPCHREKAFIRGSTTLGELEAHTGISMAVILGELKLPADLGKEERLRTLRERYGVSMQQVREVVHRLKAGEVK